MKVSGLRPSPHLVERYLQMVATGERARRLRNDARVARHTFMMLKLRRLRRDHEERDGAL